MAQVSLGHMDRIWIGFPPGSQECPVIFADSSLFASGSLSAAPVFNGTRAGFRGARAMAGPPNALPSKESDCFT